MNDLTVLQASQGLAIYVEKNVVNALSRGVVVGHDHRHHSQRFAQLAQLAFVQRGFKIYDLGLCHTPLVPFGVDHMNACVGVMVTASHSPARDNGYKVYLASLRPGEKLPRACQIIPPHDSGIAAAIDENLEPWSWDTELLKSELLVDRRQEIEDAYFKAISDRLHWSEPIRDAKVAYTPMHGVGLKPFLRIVREFGIDESNIIVVPEQRELDPDFATVSFPNPEEQGALDLGIATAKANECDYVLSNDPDADRCALVVRDPTTGKFVQLTGNQLGILFASFVHSMAAKSTKG
jgi:phosphoglucomutase